MEGCPLLAELFSALFTLRHDLVRGTNFSKLGGGVDAEVVDRAHSNQWQLPTISIARALVLQHLLSKDLLIACDFFVTHGF